jgi:hypothetical protein
MEDNPVVMVEAIVWIAALAGLVGVFSLLMSKARLAIARASARPPSARSTTC